LLGVTVSNFGSAPANADEALPLFGVGADCEPSVAVVGAP
jgi:hypothetical protein